MTSTEDRTEYRDSDHYRETAASLSARPPLPTVEQIAGPILRGLLTLHDLGSYDGIVDGFEFGVDQGEFLDEAHALLKLVEDVATALEIGVAKFLRHDARARNPDNARAIVMAVADVDGLRLTLHTPDHDRLTYDD